MRGGESFDEAGRQNVARLQHSASFAAVSPKKKDRRALRDRPLVIVPLAKETQFGSAIGGRTASLANFKELGPPDLIHIAEYNKSSHKEEGFYHYITGLDLSSGVAVIGYITALSLNHMAASLKHPSSFTYCSFNAFGRSDVRIKIELPKPEPTSAELQLIPADRGKKIMYEIRPQVWDEVFVSAMVRSIIINEDFERKLPTLVEKSLFQSIASIKFIINKFIAFLDRGFMLGAASTIQRPTNRENYLIDALYKVLELSGLYQYAIDLIEAKQDSYYDVVLIKLLFLNNREILAIKRLCAAIQLNPRDPLLLTQQVDFLLTKRKVELAYRVSLKAVEASPISSDCWFNLVKCQILNDDINGALASLNSTPMYPERPKDIQQFNSTDTHEFPFPSQGKVESVWERPLAYICGLNSENLIKQSARHEVQAADPALLRINRVCLRGTYAKAYELLVLIINKIGWDGLLKRRSEVFIMDDEYKKNVSTISLKSEKIFEDNFKGKRLCEKWLDELFLMLYEDLRVVLIVDNELSKIQTLKHSALEWHLIGLTAYRTTHFKSSISALRTALTAQFDIISALKLLKLWEQKNFDTEFQMINGSNRNGEIDMSLDTVLDILVRAISYNTRFYNEFQLDLLLILRKLTSKVDIDYVKNKIQIKFENDNDDLTNGGVIPVFDKLVSSLQSKAE